MVATPQRPIAPTSSTGLYWQTTDDGSRTLWDERLDETYHSSCGAVAESLVVYLLNSGVHERLRTGQATAVLEYGFGTATAFLLTAADAMIHRTTLRYRALEISLLPAEVFGELKLNGSVINPIYQSEFGGLLGVARRLLDELVDWRMKLPLFVADGAYTCTFGEHVTLELVVGNAVNYVADKSSDYDAVYFDPFSPASCPVLWSCDVFRSAFRCLRDGGVLTSYCVKGSVRRDLTSVGFEVRRLPGPIGGKREVLQATKTASGA